MTETPISDRTVSRDQVSDLHNAFLLGATIAELQGRIRVAALDTKLGDTATHAAPVDSERASFVPYVEVDSDVSWATSAWRVLFERISLLHSGFFASSTTDQTRYDPGIKVPPYYFPDAPSYADVGIAPDPDTKPVLQNFKLRDVTRRGINCLALLFINPDVSLLPETVRAEQQRLIDAVTAAGGGNTKDSAISAVTRALLLYVHAWEGFLRESFYAAGIDRQNQNNLIAFEAGLAVTWMSWAISVVPKGDDITKRRDLWTSTFGDADVSRLQHQLGVVCTALDDARQARDPNAKASAQAAGDAVKRSLDYWQRAVVWLCRRPTAANMPREDKNADVAELSADDWDRLRQALIEQTSIWQTLVLEQQSLESFSAEAVTQSILQEVAASFQELATNKGLFGAAEEVGRTVVEAAEITTVQFQAIAGKTLRAVVNSFWPVLVVLAVVLVVGVAVLAQHLATGSTSTLVADLTTPITALVGGAALLLTQQRNSMQVPGTPKTTSGTSTEATGQPSTTTSSDGWTSVTTRVEGLVGQVSNTILADFARGYDQAKEDLAILGRSVGVSYPLVEYFVLNQAWRSLSADIQFMEEVVWNATDRRTEIVRVASAAFGPVGAFAIAASTQKGDSGATGGQLAAGAKTV